MNAAERVLRSTVVACLVIGIVTIATWWPRADGPIDLRWDGGAYYILGTSLATGEAFAVYYMDCFVPTYSGVHSYRTDEP